MSLFQTFQFPANDWSPLFNLLDDYDNHRSRRGQTTVRSFAPRFDVRESTDAYHLDGELPGIAQKDIDIEFTDPQTLVIKGRSQREYRSATPPSPSAEEQQAESQGDESSNSSGSEEGVKFSDDKKVSTKTAHTKPRYWVSERSVGQFQRTFSFPTRVAQDDVRASLRDGILSLVVPKAAPPAARKITIQ
ncbi:HSP20-like chaperone [Aspergillus pseudoustus]|uniref:HSP20-like chaperone n=1 Tax=Aspergillus pseudoustus TaxID=1810923 RepID=A0ABR4KXL4_9EURO